MRAFCCLALCLYGLSWQSFAAGGRTVNCTTQTVSLSPVFVNIEPHTAVVLRTIETVRAEKKVHAVYFCEGTSQMDALRRLIKLHMSGIIHIAKLTPKDKDGPELKSRYAAEDQMIIVFSADDKEIARLSQQSSEEEFMKWNLLVGEKLAERQ